MDRYVDQYVWLRTDGGIAGVNLEWLNSKIDEYNRNPFLVDLHCFWEWLSWDTDDNFYGLSHVQSKLNSRLHPIKSGRNQNE